MLVHVLVASACLQFATSIRCYDCNSANNTMCLDPNSYDQDTLRRFMVLAECGQGVIPKNQRYFCRKIEQVVYHKYRETEMRVARGCGWVRSPLACYKADNENHLETVCQCFDDACNAATSVLAKWTLLVAAVTVVMNKWLKLLLVLLLKSLTNSPTVSKPKIKTI